MLHEKHSQNLKYSLQKKHAHQPKMRKTCCEKKKQTFLLVFQLGKLKFSYKF